MCRSRGELGLDAMRHTVRTSLYFAIAASFVAVGTPTGADVFRDADEAAGLAENEEIAMQDELLRLRAENRQLQSAILGDSVARQRTDDQNVHLAEAAATAARSAAEAATAAVRAVNSGNAHEAIGSSNTLLRRESREDAMAALAAESDYSADGSRSRAAAMQRQGGMLSSNGQHQDTGAESENYADVEVVVEDETAPAAASLSPRNGEEDAEVEVDVEPQSYEEADVAASQRREVHHLSARRRLHPSVRLERLAQSAATNRRHTGNRESRVLNAVGQADEADDVTEHPDQVMLGTKVAMNEFEDASSRPRASEKEDQAYVRAANGFSDDNAVSRGRHTEVPRHRSKSQYGRRRQSDDVENEDQSAAGEEMLERERESSSREGARLHLHGRRQRTVRQRSHDRSACEWGSWQEWSACSVSCGKGIQSRIREERTSTSVLQDGVRFCGEPKMEADELKCVLKACPSSPRYSRHAAASWDTETVVYSVAQFISGLR